LKRLEGERGRKGEIYIKKFHSCGGVRGGFQLKETRNPHDM
jgi:hypothetical protein